MPFDKQTAKRITQMGITGGHYRDRYLDIAREMATSLDRIDELEAALIEERARRICHAPTDPVGHWPAYEEAVVGEAKMQLRAEGKI